MYSELWRNQQPQISAPQNEEELPKPLTMEALTRASYELSVGAQVALASCIGAWKVCTEIFLFLIVVIFVLTEYVRAGQQT